MSRADNRHRPDEGPKKHTTLPWEKPRELTAREQVVQILAEGIWEMVLAGNGPRRSAAAQHSKHIAGS